MSETSFNKIMILAVLLAGLVVYLNTFDNEFVWDDVSSVQINKHIQDPSFFFQLFAEEQHPFSRQAGGNFYRPLVAASFMLDYWLVGGSSLPPSDSNIPEVPTWSFHFTNMALHMAVGVLLFLLLSRFQAPRFVRAAVPLLYIVHPLHTEAVAYISGRADMLAAAFLFGALLLSLREGSLQQRIWGTGLSLVLFCLALLSKESATIYPLLLGLAIAGRPDTEPDSAKSSVLMRILPLLLSIGILAIYAGLRMSVLKFGSSEAVQSSLQTRIVETLQALATYIGLLFAPVGLHMERTLSGATGLTTALGLLALLGLTGILAGAFMLRSRLEPGRRVALAVGWFIVTWLPISGLFPLNAPMAEHWMYVPLAGLLWALLEMLVLAARSSHVRWGLAALLCGWGLFLVFLSVQRNDDWRDNQTLFVKTLEQNPNTSRVHMNLAVVYEDVLKNETGARRHYERALELYSQKKKLAASAGERLPVWEQELDAHLSLAKIYFGQRKYEKAAEHYGLLANIEGDEKYGAYVGEGSLGLARCYFAVGQDKAGYEAISKALAAAPFLKDEVRSLLDTVL